MRLSQCLCLIKYRRLFNVVTAISLSSAYGKPVPQPSHVYGIHHTAEPTCRYGYNNAYAILRETPPDVGTDRVVQLLPKVRTKSLEVLRVYGRNV